MSGGKETGRQKMIGMMYLVLTALLAMNISKDVLNAFITLEEGLTKTNEIFDEKNSVLYAKFEKGLSENKTKTKPWADKAFAVRKAAEELCKFVHDSKAELYTMVEKDLTKEVADTFKLKRSDSKDNYDIPTTYLVGPDVAKPTGRGVEIKKRMAEFRKLCIESIPEKQRAGLKLGLNTDDAPNHEGVVEPWEVANFDHTTVAASMCLLEAIINDAKSAESDVVNILLTAIDAGDFKFDAIEAKVVANANYITAGEDYTADIFVSAHSSTQNPQILIGAVDTSDSKHPKLLGAGTDVPVNSGVGKYIVHTSAEGDQDYSGVINVKAPDGSIKLYPFSGKYTVAKPSMAVSPTKMNVFYIALDNPVDISVAGVAPKDVSASISGGSGTIKPIGGGHFIVNVKNGDAKGEVSINVSKKTASGNKSAGPPVIFRVKKVPSPAASFAGVKGDGFVSAGEVKLCSGVIPQLDDFVFDLKFPVISWNMSMMVNGLWVDKGAQGPGTTGEQKNLLSKAAKGARILIEDVWVMAPDGKRKIAGCTLKIK